MKKIEVVAAVIVNEEKYLCVKRNFSKYDYISYKYEFPGGKIESGETESEALIREIMEELTIEVKVNNKLITVNHQYPDFHLDMHTYCCEIKSGSIKLNEHVDMIWLSKEELHQLDWAEADIPIVNMIQERL